MKISEARRVYYANRMQLDSQMRDISKRKTEAEDRYKLTGDSSFGEEAASLELSYQSLKKTFDENQKVLDSLMEQWISVFDVKSSQNAGEAMAEEAKNIGRIMTVFRRMAHGDIVPPYDEKKLMEYDDKMYQAAKNMQIMAQQMEKERKKYKSLWEDEEKPDPQDPLKAADNAEYIGVLPDIGIPETSQPVDIEG